MNYVPPEAFGIVEEGVYRSNLIESSNFSFLQTLHLHSILFLSSEQPSREVYNFITEHSIELNHLSKDTTNTSGDDGVGSHSSNNGSSWRPLSEELIKEGLEYVLNTKNYPVLIMCTLGIHETGTLVACLRKLMNWNYNSIVVEYRMYAGSRSRYINEQFVELFDMDLVTLPLNTPKWIL